MGKKYIVHNPRTSGYFNVVLEENGRISKWEPVEKKKKEVNGE